MAKRLMAWTTLRLLPGVLFLSLWAGLVQADPNNGLGLYFGGVHSSDSSLYGTGRGVALGVDAQMAVSADWTLNPYLELTSENTDSSYTVVNGAGGLQARRWFGSWFFGGQFLFHDLLVRQNGTVGASYYGPAVGLALGWEGDSNWSVVLEANAFEGQGVNLSTSNDRSDVRLLIGYRWK